MKLVTGSIVSANVDGVISAYVLSSMGLHYGQYYAYHLLPDNDDRFLGDGVFIEESAIINPFAEIVDTLTKL